MSKYLIFYGGSLFFDRFYLFEKGLIFLVCLYVGDARFQFLDFFAGVVKCSFLIAFLFFEGINLLFYGIEIILRVP